MKALLTSTTNSKFRVFRADSNTCVLDWSRHFWETALAHHVSPAFGVVRA